MAVDLSDLSHSYPFLHLSRKFGFKYEAILEMAARYDRGEKPPTVLPMSGMVVFKREVMALQAIYDVCHAPWRWDLSRAGERGL